MSDASAPVALITGGSHGVGRAIAIALAHQGYDIVLLHSLGGVDAALATLDVLRSVRPRSAAIPADVADEHQVSEAFSHVVESHGRVDVVIHGAGFLRLEAVAEMDLAHLDAVIGTVVRGAFLIGREASRVMDSGGSIVMLSSATVGLAVQGSAPYVAAKAALEGLTRVFAEELRDRRISVNAVAMGPTVTEASILGGSVPVADEDIGEFVSFLTGRRGRWMTGQIIGRTIG